jgi:hypothetical protein
MDGCSMGIESHFASTLIAKILRKAADGISYKVFIEKTVKSESEYLKEVMNELFRNLQSVKNQLRLEKTEVLSTLILAIINYKNKTAQILTIGDGLICKNGTYIEYEQDDKPDYLGYHLNEDFETWYQSQTQRLSFNNLTDLSISTDGIFTFKKFDNKTYENITNQELRNLLLKDEKWKDQEQMLHKKLINIEQRFGLKPSDDLSILRVIL